MSDLFDSLQQEVATIGADAALERLAERLAEEKRFHELFDVRLMAARRRLGLPLVSGASIDELPEPLRSQTEEAYLNACRQVGELLAAEGKLRDAWMYLRPTGATQAVVDALQRAEPKEENLDELIELALHEGIAPGLGFQWMLDHFGTCNSITTFEGVIGHLPQAVQVELAERLVDHLYRDLHENVLAHVRQRHPETADGVTLAELVAAHGWIFENEAYHIDLSHLGSTVRFARLVERPESLEKAWALTEYGRRLAASHQTEGEPPFAELYPAHAHLFAASLGRQVDAALAYFRQQAEAVDAQHYGTAAIETYLILLVRAGRHAEALEETARLAPTGQKLSPYAPKMYDLAAATGDFTRYLEICRERGDVLGYAAGLAATQKPV